MNNNEAIDGAHHSGELHDVIPAGVSSGLYNQDLAPSKKQGRTWSAYNIFALWANDVHSLGNYSYVLGLFALGMSGWQILTALMLGAVFLFVLLNLSGYMGIKTGVPFPVMSRISFGTRGAQIPALIRGGVAIVWFGIQTALAANCVGRLRRRWSVAACGCRSSGPRASGWRSTARSSSISATSPVARYRAGRW